jgi:hypothetical protein
MQKQFPQFFTQCSAARLARLVHTQTARLEQCDDSRDLTALACPIDPFKGDETAFY